MKCPNCASTDVIRVQDQFFCVNCGNLVVPPKPVAAPIPVVIPDTRGLPYGIRILPSNPPDAGHKSSGTVVRKRKPGRPKAARLDIPALQPSITKFAQQPTDAASSVVAPPLPKAIGAASDAPARTLSDISHSKPPEAIRRPVTNVINQPVPFNDLMSASLRGRFNAIHLALALLPAALLGIVAAFIVTVVAGRAVTPELLLPKDGMVRIAGELLILGAIYYAARSFTQGAIMFGAARQLDHRPIPVARWFDTSARSFMVRLRFDVMMGMKQLAVTGLIVGLVYTGGMPWPVPAWVQLGLLFATHLLLVYLLVGLMLSQGLGHTALVLSTITARQAIRLGWTFFRHHFELLGLKGLTLLFEMVLLFPLVAAIAATILLLPEQQSWPLAAGIGVGVALAGTSMGAASALWWQSAYRRLVRTERLGEAVGLLGGRKPGPGTQAAGWLTAAIVVLAIGAALWPLIPLHGFNGY